MAVAIRRGLPLWEIGYDERPWTERRPDLPAVVEGRPTLHLATGLLDERRVKLGSDHKCYEQFLWALRWQDTWSPEEHAGFWEWALALWPQSQKPRHRDALAFAVAYAVEQLSDHRRKLDGQSVAYGSLGDYMTGPALADAAADLDTFCGRLGIEFGRGDPIPGFTRTHSDIGDLARLGVLAEAHQMLAAPRHHLRTETGRLPRVALDGSTTPTAAQFAAFSDHATAHDSSHAVRRAAIKVVAVMKREMTGTSAPEAVEPTAVQPLCQDCLAEWYNKPIDNRSAVSLNAVDDCAWCGRAPNA